MAKGINTPAVSQDEALIALFLGATDMIETIEENNAACNEGERKCLRLEIQQ